MVRVGSGKQVQAEVRQLISDFLATRRAGLQPERAGLSMGPNRRVRGLRREEVAALAGISVEYYVRLERGHANGASDGVLEGVSRALQLDPAERSHLNDLLRSSSGTRSCEVRTAPGTLRPPVQRILDSMSSTPAIVLNAGLEVVGANALGRALLPETGDLARSLFLDPGSRMFWREWDEMADDAANRLRAEAGRNPCDRSLTGLITELSSKSAEFRARWARHDVRVQTSGTRRIHHPIVGDLELPFESTPLVSDPGLTLLMFTAEAESASEDALKLLAIPDRGRHTRPGVAHTGIHEHPQPSR